MLKVCINISSPQGVSLIAPPFLSSAAIHIIIILSTIIMFRRLAQTVGNALRSKFPTASAAAQQNPVIHYQPTIHSVLRDAAAAKATAEGKSADKSQKLALAHQDLQNAVKELSLGSALPVSSPPVETLKAWQELSTAELTVEQAEELARVYFEGSNGVSEDKVKALELWKFASERGSIEGKYSQALCLKDGVGTERNPQEAHDLLLELTEKKNYHLAHVSISCGCENMSKILSR